MTAVRKGKKNCPESKALEESIIENAFVMVLNTICRDNKSIVTEFLDNVEHGLHNKENKEQLNKLNAEINSTEMKINKLLDLHLEGKVDKIAYEEKYEQLRQTFAELKTNSIDLDNVVDDGKVLKNRLTAFRKLFESGASLTAFDPDVFKTVVEEVILGGYNEDGAADPYMLTFVFKTGLTTKVDGRKNKGNNKGKSEDKKCSHQSDNPL